MPTQRQVKNKFESGIIDPLSLSALGFLVFSLLTTAVVINRSGANFNPFSFASGGAKWCVENGCKGKGCVVCNKTGSGNGNNNNNNSTTPSGDCILNQTACLSSTQVVTCITEAAPRNYPHYSSPKTCANGCSGGKCIGENTANSNTGSTGTATNPNQTTNKNNASTTTNNQCVTNGQLVCDGNTLKVCAAGTWQTNEACKNGCSNNKCNSPSNSNVATTNTQTGLSAAMTYCTSNGGTWVTSSNSCQMPSTKACKVCRSGACSSTHESGCNNEKNTCNSDKDCASTLVSNNFVPSPLPTPTQTPVPARCIAKFVQDYGCGQKGCLLRERAQLWNTAFCTNTVICVNNNTCDYDISGNKRSTECVPNTQECAGSIFKTCSSSGNWINTDCGTGKCTTNGCVNNSTTNSTNQVSSNTSTSGTGPQKPSCNPNQKVCSSLSSYLFCDPDGTSSTVINCPENKICLSGGCVVNPNAKLAIGNGCSLGNPLACESGYCSPATLKCENPYLPVSLPVNPPNNNSQQNQNGNYSQNDPNWKYKPVKVNCNGTTEEKTMAQVGCGPTNVANILNTYANENVNPYQLATDPNMYQIDDWKCKGNTPSSNLDILASKKFKFEVDLYNKSLFNLTKNMSPTDILWITGTANGKTAHHTIIEGYSLDANGQPTFNLVDPDPEEFGSNMKCRISGDNTFKCTNAEGKQTTITTDSVPGVGPGVFYIISPPNH